MLARCTPSNTVSNNADNMVWYSYKFLTIGDFRDAGNHFWWNHAAADGPR